MRGFRRSAAIQGERQARQRAHDESLLYDIIAACRLIQQFTAGKTLADYLADPLLRSAVERQCGIAGEALNQACRLEPMLAPRISYRPQIIAFRNRLVHGYATVADDVVWGIVEEYLPTLQREAAALLNEKESGM